MNIENKVEDRACQRLKLFNYKYLLLVFLGVIMLICIDIRPSDNGMFIYFLDVGQGDSIIVKDYDYTFMIDGGGDRFISDDNNTGKTVVYPFLLNQNIKKIDCIFVTHVHYDHIKGVLEVIDLVDVGTVVLPIVYEEYYNNRLNDSKQFEKKEIGIETDVSESSQEFVHSIFQGGDELFLLEELISKTEALNIDLMFMKEGEVVQGQSSIFTCIYPYEGKLYSENENENSLVLKLELGSVRTLLTGDIEEEGEQWMVSHSQNIEDINILKVPHHGSNSSSTEEFLLKINPLIAIVSVGENLFGHPSDIVRMRYKNLNIPFYSTQKYGMIKVIVKKDYYKIVPYKGELIDESITRTIKD